MPKWINKIGDYLECVRGNLGAVKENSLAILIKNNLMGDLHLTQ
jgi:hypothetical protein